MMFALIIGFLLTALVGLITYLLARRQGQLQLNAVSCELARSRQEFLTAKTDFEARYQELRMSLEEARRRENDARTQAKESAEQRVELGNELKIALEGKGRFQNEAARVDEVRGLVVERDRQIESLQTRIAGLEREKAEALKDAEAADRRAKEMIDKERETQAEIIKAKDEHIEKLNEFVTHAREVLTTEFKALSADALTKVTAQLIQTAESIIEKNEEKTTADVRFRQQQIETMLKPVEETIKRLDKHVEDSNVSRSKAEAVLDDQVKRLAGASESLTNALRKPVVKGSWGEMTLENAFENAGLEPEIDFVLQHTTDAEGGRRRTDAIVNLPKGRKLIIDSKNLMDSYIAFVNAENETQKAALAEIHSKSLRAHIKQLSAKEYWQRYKGLDCVILFIPHEGMYHAAVRDEAELIREASEKRVFISNPMTLMPLLKAIRYVLDQETLNKSAEEISRVGMELYVEVTRFAGHMSTIGDRLKSTVKAYNEAIPRLDRFIVAKSRKLKQLGSAKGAEPKLPEEIELEPRTFSSQELRDQKVVTDRNGDADRVKPSLAALRTAI